jgi:elongation factor G
MTGQGGKIHGILWFAIESLSADDRADFQQQFGWFIQAHPTFRIQVNDSENGLIAIGDDELELMAFRGSIAHRYGANLGELRISYKESIRRRADGEGKYIRHSGGAGNYGHVKIRLEPAHSGKGFEFVNDIKGGTVPEEYVQWAEQGIREALSGGVLAGYEIVDIKATLVDGSYRDVDSNGMAFKIAGSIALKEAARQAMPVLLEPVMSVEMLAPEEFTRTILTDINSRRGQIEGMQLVGGARAIRANIPLAEVLSSSEYGRPKYPMHFAGYQPAPPPNGQFGGSAGAPVRKPSNPRVGTGSPKSMTS